MFKNSSPFTDWFFFYLRRITSTLEIIYRYLCSDNFSFCWYSLLQIIGIVHSLLPLQFKVDYCYHEVCYMAVFFICLVTDFFFLIKLLVKTTFIFITIYSNNYQLNNGMFAMIWEIGFRIWFANGHPRMETLVSNIWDWGGGHILRRIWSS